MRALNVVAGMEFMPAQAWIRIVLQFGLIV